MKLANATVIDFQDLPKEIKDHFIAKWRSKFSIDTEKDECVNLKKESTFIHFVVKANGKNKALEQAKDIAEDTFHVVRFVYEINFNLIDIMYVIREDGNSGGQTDIAGLPFCGSANYAEILGKSIKIITKIFSKKNPNDIEKRIKNAVRIFGIQTSITNSHVRFLLLVACLEALLMQKSDSIRWRLAEKTAFILGENKRQTFKYIKEAYDKRSDFVHGTPKKLEPITGDDISKAEKIVGHVIWKLIVEFLGKGYTQIPKEGTPKKKILSIDEYIEQEKFGKS